MSVLRSIFTTFAKFEVISKKNQKVKNTILLCVCNSLNCYLRLFIHLDLILTSNPFIGFSLAKFRILIGQLLSSSSFQDSQMLQLLSRFFHVWKPPPTLSSEQCCWDRMLFILFSVPQNFGKSTSKFSGVRCVCSGLVFYLFIRNLLFFAWAPEQ